MFGNKYTASQFLMECIWEDYRSDWLEKTQHKSILPVAQRVEPGASEAKAMVLNHREWMSW